jgi:gamma-glutamylcyclotransferase (GGCT)/AIG2-like uncharacterized protein YtfP
MTFKRLPQYMPQMQQGLRIAEPPPTIPDVKASDANPSIFDDPWNDEDTQPGLGPVVHKPENKMSQKPREIERSNLMFVFGRYREGFNLHRVVARDKGFKGITRTLPEFKLININGEFPVVIPDGKGRVVGEVYECENRTFDFMDSLEECPGTQNRVIISLENGARAHMYLLPKHKAPNREEEIPSGDWVEWKRNERSREKEKKEKFIAAMAKGKAEANRKRAIEEEQAALAAAHRVANPTNHLANLWDPIRGKWEKVPPSNDTKTSREITVYSSKNGKNHVHVSDVDMVVLRAKLISDNQSVPETDSQIRNKIMSIYGVWFEIG